MRKRTVWELLKIYPTMMHPIDCENGCGAVIELSDAYESYAKRSDGLRMLICECCAEELGHLNEEYEEPENAPVCKRRVKQ